MWFIRSNLRAHILCLHGWIYAEPPLYSESSCHHQVTSVWDSTSPTARVVTSFALSPINELMLQKEVIHLVVAAQSLGWKTPWRRAWQPTPGFLPGESHGQRGLVGFSPWGRQVSDTTPHLNNNNKSFHKILFWVWFWKARRGVVKCTGWPQGSRAESEVRTESGHREN